MTGLCGSHQSWSPHKLDSTGGLEIWGIGLADSSSVTDILNLKTFDGGTIAFLAIASTFNALAAQADDGIAVEVDLTTATGALILDGDFDNAIDTSDNISVEDGRTVSSRGMMVLDAATRGESSFCECLSSHPLSSQSMSAHLLACYCSSNDCTNMRVPTQVIGFW